MKIPQVAHDNAIAWLYNLTLSHMKVLQDSQENFDKLILDLVGPDPIPTKT